MSTDVLAQEPDPELWEMYKAWCLENNVLPTPGAYQIWLDEQEFDDKGNEDWERDNGWED